MALVKKGELPANVPASVDSAYLDSGWLGWGDFLGTAVIQTQKREYRPFAEARQFVRGLGLKSAIAYKSYKNLPADVPRTPSQVYQDAGWVTWGDWLGTRAVGPGKRTYRSFLEARKLVQTLGLQTTDEWRVYCQSGRKPADIPATPDRVYKNAGWAGVGDWLGTGVVATQKRTYRAFAEARRFVRALGLRGQEQWKAYCTSGEKPKDVPSAPWDVYRDKGWVSTPDWLGTRQGSL